MAVTVALVAACAGGVAYFFLDAQAETKEIEAVLEDFMTKTTDRQFVQAYDLFAQDAKSTITAQEFGRSAATNPAYGDFVDIKKTGWKKGFASDGPDIFEFDGNVTYSDGKGTIYAEMVKESGDWKIRYIELNKSP